jgi:hypothetical protein
MNRPQKRASQRIRRIWPYGTSPTHIGSSGVFTNGNRPRSSTPSSSRFRKLLRVYRPPCRMRRNSCEGDWTSSYSFVPKVTRTGCLDYRRNLAPIRYSSGSKFSSARVDSFVASFRLAIFSLKIGPELRRRCTLLHHGWRVIVAALEAAALGVDLQQPVDGLGLEAGRLGHTLGGAAGRSA